MRQTLNNGGVVGRCEVRQHARAASSQNAVGAENVFVSDRHAGQRTCRAARQLLISQSCSLQSLIARDCDEGVELGIEALDTSQEVLRDLSAGESARTQASSQLTECVMMKFGHGLLQFCG